MKKQLVASVCIILSPFLMVSCVSSLLQEKAPTFSKEISYKDPTQNIFTKVNVSVFPTWKNLKTGNVISLISECNETGSGGSLSLSLVSLQQLITSSIENAKIQLQQNLTFKQRPALLYVTDGTLDGESISIRSVSFKRKNCGYVSSLSGRPSMINTDLKAFDEFNESLSFE